jgi:hypothetical protein
MQNNEESNDRKMKQKYLKEQITANKWDFEEFTLYLEEKKEDGMLIRYEYRQLGV